jgi:hypothetical protein
VLRWLDVLSIAGWTLAVITAFAFGVLFHRWALAPKPTGRRAKNRVDAA